MNQSYLHRQVKLVIVITIILIFTCALFQTKTLAKENQGLPEAIQVSEEARLRSVGVGDSGTLNLKGSPITQGKVPVIESWNIHGVAIAEHQSYIKMYGSGGSGPYSVYCMDYGKGANTGDVLSGRDFQNLDNFSPEIKRLLGACLSFGFHEQAENLNQEQKAQYAATQAMVWTVMAELFDTEEGEEAAKQYLSYVEQPKEAVAFFFDLKRQMLTYDKIPSYASATKETAREYQLDWNKEAGRYEVVVEDTEQLQGAYSFQMPQGLNVEYNNQKVTLYTNQVFAESTLFEGKRTDLTLRESVLYWNDDPAIQRFGVSNLDVKVERNPFYIHLRTKPAELEVKKIDKETKKTQSQITGKPWEGAVYELYNASYKEGDNKESDSFVSELTINQEGTTSIKELPLGTYFLKEGIPPEGYLADETIYQVTLPTEDSDTPLRVQVTSEEQVIRGDVELMKFGQEKPGEQSEVKRPLQGVEFTLTSATNGRKYTIVTDESGYATTKSLGNPLGGLLYGTYLLEETKGVEGYKTIEPIHITIDKAQQVLRYVIEDKRIQSAIRIVKVDAETKERIPLAGTAFQILDEEGKVVELHTYYPSYEKIDTFVTDESGSVTLPEPLGIGTYTLVETKAPKGYLKAEPMVFEVTEFYDFEEPLTLICEDQPIRGKICIQKTDGTTGKKLAGVEFQIWQEETLIETLVTDVDGVATSGELLLGSYEVVESKALPGYESLSDGIGVELTEDERETPVITYELNVENHPITPETVTPKTGDGTRLQVLLLFAFLSCVTVMRYAKIAIRDR